MDYKESELPEYKCHKKVKAIKITKVVISETVGGRSNRIITGGVKPFTVSQEYMDKHKPQKGGYYVLYEDGYESYSPAKAFEDGYMLYTKRK